MPFGNLLDFLIYIPAILIGITFHEFAHGFVAYRLGDPTPKDQGRLTLNPVAHLDPLGTLLLLFAHFGWAKPVQVNPYYFEGDKRRGMMIVSLAGPFMNVVLAYLGALLLGLALRQTIPINDIMLKFLSDLVQINLILAAFNLIPVPPLDGSKILAGILPRESANFIYRMEQYGPLILMLLIVTGLSQNIFGPIVKFLAMIIFTATGIPYSY
ncbi:site-2 protease family protein [Candidatus Formimonas warabiya]|uniref:Site-2 protease family protein n=1 Tax=Formimonas warabiya TaxID=1761012 RepID=A0A3G1KNQ7_FORW1|nr:site-2 protease family protein [Candidatus Formimonas warabiya]ATW24087.1 site-2 protease family protein [Candidatus Formimonas warabiya]